MNKTVQISLLALLLALPAAGANWTNYTDDFSSNQVESDSYRHSTFYENGINPMPESYLRYHEVGADRGLLFVNYEDRPAELGYCVSYDAAQSRRMITGTFTVKVSFPCDADVSQFPSGELFYSISPDGMAWSEKQSLGWQGDHTIPFRSPEGRCYILLSGARARIDNVRVSVSSPSATWRVPGSFATIQQAVNFARDGDVIEVLPGQYTGTGNWDLDFLGKRIILRSTGGPQNTTILCGAGHRGFYFHTGETSESIVSGFTISGARLTGSATLGGGIYCEAASPTILNCIIDSCAAGLGGGVAGVDSDLTLSSSTITNCSATAQGAGIYLLDGSPTIAGCTISGNTVSGLSQGGGVFCTGAPLDATFRNCVVSGNSATAGGGIFAERFTASDPSCRVSIVNCTIAGNSSGINASNADVTILNSIVWANSGSAVVPQYAVSANYSDIQGGYWGQGNINTDPWFADSKYHLSFGSPCIDAGDPSSSVAAEPSPNGERINMGAYGGTTEAAEGVRHTIYHVNMQTGRSWYDGRSQTRPFATIQAGINAASDGDTVLVWPGVYQEEITFNGKAITVRSAADAAVITASKMKGYACTFSMAEGADSVLANFVIADCSEAGIFCDGASPTLKNLTIVNNPIGISVYGGARPDIANCIIWGNTGASLSAWEASYQWDISYSCVEATAWDVKSSNFSRLVSSGNTSSDPLFADLASGDYHLQSRYGRYVSASGTWAIGDAKMSPCIDAGDPWDDSRSEPMGNGDRINMGAYGGTRYASKSSEPVCH